MRGPEVQTAIASCGRCKFVDKPPCLHRVYERFLSPRLVTLVISESPPPGPKPDYLYNLGGRDRLRSVLARVFGVDEREVPVFLARHGVFWTTAVKCRPPSRADVEPMRARCVSILRLELEVLRPRRVVALGRAAWRSVEEAGASRLLACKHYHPLFLARFMKRGLPELRRCVLGRDGVRGP